MMDFQIEYGFSGEKLEELDRQLRLLLTTRAGALPLDRDFGLEMDFLDRPPEVAKTLIVAEITRKVAKYIPEIRVKAVTFDPAEAGTLRLRVVITSA